MGRIGKYISKIVISLFLSMPAGMLTVHGTDLKEVDPLTESTFVSETSSDPGFLFDDVQDKTKSFYEPVYWAVEKNITTGTSQDPPLFSPFKTCTRAQFVTFLWRMKGSPEPSSTKNPFKDVETGKSYSKAVLWAFENKVTTGTSDTTFSPFKNVTRAQVATFIWRACGEPSARGVNPFKDVAEGKSFTIPVTWMVENGITTGKSETSYAPSDNCTRAQTVTFLYRLDNYLSKEGDVPKTVSYSNGDKVYVPPVEDLTLDNDTFEIFYKYLLNVYLFKQPTDKNIHMLEGMVNGKTVGKKTGSVNMIQILTSEESFSGLQALAAKLMQDNNVLYADIEIPICMEESADNNPWSSDSNKPEKDRGNEDKPGGNDWWAEAIGAYTAWENTPMNPIDVGVIDNGFQINHDDLKKIKILKGYSNTIDRGKNDNPDHGTHVAGVIAADNNSIGIRGIADKATLYCADWSPGANVNLLSFEEYSEMQKQMIEKGTKVINNSWGTYVMSSVGYTNANYEENMFYKAFIHHVILDDGTYDNYLKATRKNAFREADRCIAFMIEELLNGKDYIIVQAAGNGYDNAGPGYDTTMHGSFCAIDELGFKILPQDKIDELQGKGITYEDIEGRKIIVGAVENSRNKDGNYKMTSFSNFGNNVDICAPGKDIYSTITDYSYGKMNGTSMAAPMVAASAAYCWSLNPSLTGPEVKDLLIKNHSCDAYGVGEGSSYPKPMLNIGLAAQAAKDSVNENMEKKLQGLWRRSNSVATMFYFDHGEVTVYDQAVSDYNYGKPLDTPYKKTGTYKYTIEEITLSVGPGYNIKFEGGGQYFLSDEYPNLLANYWIDANGNFNYSGGSSLDRVTQYTIDDLDIQD